MNLQHIVVPENKNALKNISKGHRNQPKLMAQLDQIIRIIAIAAAAAKSLQLYPTLCDPRNGSPPGSPFPGILQARTVEWVAISFSNAWKWKGKVKSLSRARLLANPWRSQPGSSIHGIFQARVLEWGAIAFSVIAINPNKIIIIEPIWLNTLILNKNVHTDRNI